MAHQTDPKDPNSWIYGHTIGEYPNVAKDLALGKSMPTNPSVVRSDEAKNFVDTNNARGVSGSQPQDFSAYGGLKTFMPDATKMYNAMYGVSEEEQAKEDRIRLGMNMLTFFTQMGAEASKPGATALGAANIAGANTAQQYINQVEAKRTREDKKKSGVIDLASKLATFDATKSKANKTQLFTNNTDKPITLNNGKIVRANSNIRLSEKDIVASGDNVNLLVPYVKPEKQDSKIYTNTSKLDIIIDGVTLKPNESSRFSTNAINSIDGKIASNLSEQKTYTPSQKDRDRDNLYDLGSRFDTLTSKEYNLYSQLFQQAMKGKPTKVINPITKMEETVYEGGIDLSHFKLLPVPEGVDPDKIIASKRQVYSQDQTNSGEFAVRMISTDGIVNNLLAKGYKPNVTDLVSQLERFRQLGSIGATSTDAQRYFAATHNFIAAKLRKESGAAIGPKEYTDGLAQYFPLINESAQVTEDKKDRRQETMRAMAGAGMGPLLEFFPELKPFLTTKLGDKEYPIIRSQDYVKHQLENKIKTQGIFYTNTIKNLSVDQLKAKLADPNADKNLADFQIISIGNLIKKKLAEQNNAN